MRLDQAQCERVYDVMVREALLQGLTMWKTRDVCLQGAADRNNEVGRRNEGAERQGGLRSGPAPVKLRTHCGRGPRKRREPRGGREKPRGEVERARERTTWEVGGARRKKRGGDQQ